MKWVDRILCQKVRQDVQKVCKVYYSFNMCVIMSKSTPLHQIYDMLNKIMSWRQRYRKYVKVSNIFHDDKNHVMTSKTRQSEMANTSPCHIPVLGNVPPIFFRDVISLLARVFIFLIDRATQEVPIINIGKK